MFKATKSLCKSRAVVHNKDEPKIEEKNDPPPLRAPNESMNV
jgi:hypothetical protein